MRNEQINRQCKFCGKLWLTTQSGLKYHENRCTLNPNPIKIKESTRNKIIEKNKSFYTKKNGQKKLFNVVCNTCNKEFQVEEYEKKFPQQENYYCSRSCACSVGGKAKSQNMESDGTLHYRTLAIKKYGKKCIVCGESRTISVHHLDENHFNDSIENLCVLCPTCHTLIHTKQYKDEILKEIKRANSVMGTQ